MATRGAAWGSVLSLAAALALGLSVPAEAAFTPSALGEKVAASTDHPEATRAALEALAEGGNAVDGAVAAATTLGVVAPGASGIGGGGFALVYLAREKKVVAVDFRETAPAGVSADAIAERAARGEARRGVTVGTPGEPRGLEWLVRRYGKRALAADVKHAVDVATRGFPASRFLAESVSRMEGALSISPELASAFLPGGRPLAFRTTVVRSDLGRTLARFGAEGAKPFHEGDIATAIVRSVQAAGGPLSARDLQGYRVRERAPLTRTIDGRTVYTMTAPSAGGLMLTQLLTMFGATETSELRAMGFGSSEYLHTVAEAMRGAVADRVRLAGDPDHEPTVLAGYERALDKKHLAARRARIERDKTHKTPEFRTPEKGTSHLIVTDAEGNVVSLTTTINSPFGARLVAGGTGILLNDELDDFSAPADVAPFGVQGGGPNRPRPFARPVSSMTPTIILEGGRPILAVGGSGGMRIATGVVQATLARLVFGLDPTAAVSAPRVHVGVPNGELYVEPFIAEDVRAGLRARGEQVKDDPFLTTGIQMVAWEYAAGGTRILAGADPRKHSAAAAE